MTQILDEGLLRSDFTFGFELEAFVDDESELMNEIRESDDDYDYITERIDSVLKSNGMTPVENSSRTHRDGSLEDPSGLPFEYSSNVYQVTPKNIEGLINGLQQLLVEGIFTNESCGFHHHLRFNGITERDVVWIYCNMSMDPDFDDFKEFQTERNGRISLFNDNYASYEEMNNISSAIEKDDFEEVARNLTTGKYRAFRIHPQGTLEWRGPRDFLETRDFNDIKNFYITLLKLIDRIKGYINTDTLIGTSYTKEEFFNKLTNAIKNANLDPELEFLSGVASTRVKARKNNTPFSGDIERRLTTIFENDPKKFYTAVMTDQKGIHRFILSKTVNGMPSSFVRIISSVLHLKYIDKNGFAEKIFDNVISPSSNSLYIINFGIETELLKFVNTDKLTNFYNNFKSNFSSIMDLTKVYIKNGIKLKLSQVYNLILQTCYKSIYYGVEEVIKGHFYKEVLSPNQVYKIIVSLLASDEIQYPTTSMSDARDYINKYFENYPERKDEFNNFVVYKAINGNPKLLNFYIGKMPAHQLFNIITNVPADLRGYLPTDIQNKIKELNL